MGLLEPPLVFGVTLTPLVRQGLIPIPIFGCLAAILKSKLAQNLKFSQSRMGKYFGRVYNSFDAENGLFKR